MKKIDEETFELWRQKYHAARWVAQCIISVHYITVHHLCSWTEAMDMFSYCIIIFIIVHATVEVGVVVVVISVYRYEARPTDTFS